MNITLENIDKVSALITLKVEASDYQDNVQKELKKIVKQATIPGFRKGKAPLSQITKMYGLDVKAQMVNDAVGRGLYGYIQENNLRILGEPIPSEKQATLDIKAQDEFEFLFDVALAPEFTLNLSDKDKVIYYDITVDDKVVDQQVEEYSRRAGAPKDVDQYEDRAIVRGLLAELDADGNTLEGGIQVETASIMPTYLKQNAEIFENAKVNDVLTFSPWEAYAGNESEVSSLLRITKEEAQNHKGQFSFQVNNISVFVPAEVNQELFDNIFGKGEVEGEEAFRNKIKEQVSERYEADSDYKFFVDAQTYIVEKVGELQYAENILKRVLEANRPENAGELTDEAFATSLKQLTWELIKSDLVKTYECKIEEGDMQEMAEEATRFQFAQYGMQNLPEEIIKQYAGEMLKNREQAENLAQRVLDTKLIEKLKEVMTLDRQAVTLDEFVKMFE